MKIIYVKQSDGTYHKYEINTIGNWQMTGHNATPVTGMPIVDTPPTGSASEEGNTFEDFTGTAKKEEAEEVAEKAEENIATGEEMAGEECGAQNITKDMFVDPDGKQKSLQDVYAELDPILTGITGKELVNYIKDIFPKYTGVPAEEKEFAREGFQKDVYGISKPGGAAEKAGKEMQLAYGSGMGSQLRTAYGTQKDVAQQFEFAEQGYEQDIYGLEKKAGAAYEADVVGAIGGMPEGTFADPGTTGQETAWEEIDWTAREGGRVPSKSETFLDFLTQLPDAGGM